LTGRDNPVPELITFLGYEKAMEFVLVFGGQELRVPVAADIVKPLNVAGAAMAVLNRRLSPERAALDFSVDLEEVRRCVEIVKSEEKELKRQPHIVREIADELEEQREEQERSIGEL